MLVIEDLLKELIRGRIDKLTLNLSEDGRKIVPEHKDMTGHKSVVTGRVRMMVEQIDGAIGDLMLHYGHKQITITYVDKTFYAHTPNHLLFETKIVAANSGQLRGVKVLNPKGKYVRVTGENVDYFHQKIASPSDLEKIPSNITNS